MSGGGCGTGYESLYVVGCHGYRSEVVASRL